MKNCLSAWSLYRIDPIHIPNVYPKKRSFPSPSSRRKLVFFSVYFIHFFLFILGQERKFIRKVFLLTRKIAVHHSSTRLHFIPYSFLLLLLCSSTGYIIWIPRGGLRKVQICSDMHITEMEGKQLKFSENHVLKNIIAMEMFPFFVNDY